MTDAPATAMILAAGLGRRMRPITTHLPKPLVEVGGRTLLDRVLDHMIEAGVKQVVINLHHLGEKIENHMASRTVPEIRFSHEETLLETGGGVTKALPLLGNDPFFVANADVLWTDGDASAFRRLADAWDDHSMDALLLLHPTATAHGYDGPGDFNLGDAGRITRPRANTTAPLLFTGVQVLHPRLFDGYSIEPFSLNRLYDRAVGSGRLSGLIHDGEWFHVGSADGLEEAEAAL